MNKTLDDQAIAKLPKRVQAYINSLKENLSYAVRQLESIQNNDTPSAISYSVMYWTEGGGGPQVITKYIQTTSIEITHKGTTLRVVVPADDWTRVYLDASRGDVRTVIAPSASNAYEVILVPREV